MILCFGIFAFILNSTLKVTIPSTPYFIKPSLFRTLQFKTTKSSKNV